MSSISIEDPVFIQGNRARWRLVRILGEGDAGEVHLVESFLDKKIGILKRPRRNSFPADILRQANQIDTEARILNTLSYSRLASPGSIVRFTNLLDTSLPGNELTDRYFIVVERAPGLDLGLLHKLVRFGFHLPPESILNLDIFDDETRLYLHKLLEIQAIPELMILRVLLGLFDLLETIHQHPVKRIDSDFQGMVWNDIKLNHLFWDPLHANLTVIDWGNGQFLEKDCISADRLYSPTDDYRQLIEVMGKFLSECLPALYKALQWPAYLTPAEANREKLTWLKDKVASLAQERQKSLREARLHEVACLSAGAQRESGPKATPGWVEQVTKLAEIQRRIIALGELPDYAGAAKLYAYLANWLAENDMWGDFKKVCEQLTEMPTSSPDKWRLLSQIYFHADLEGGQPSDLFKEALHAGLKEDWPASLWSICKATQRDSDFARGTRWQELSSAIRAVVLNSNLETTSPYTAAIDLLRSLEEDRPWVIERLTETIVHSNLPDPEKPEKLLKKYEALITRFKNETLKKWLQTDPAPPEAGLTYSDVEAILGELEEILPRLGIDPKERLSELISALGQPKAQTEIVLDAWQAQGFKTARAGLRNLLLWDPERRRVLGIDKILETAPGWLEEARFGPKPGERQSERLQDYALRMEFQFREMRSRVSGAYWIETALQLFRELRNGRRPGEILELTPDLVDSFFWLQKYQRKPAEEQIEIKSAPKEISERGARHFSREGQLGQGQAVYLADALDAWVPEAKGSSARVFQGFLQDSNGQVRQAAIKLMRPDKVDYAMPLFQEEVQVLTRMVDIPGVARLLECGFIQFGNSGQGLPAGDGLLAAHSLVGKVIHFEPGDEDGFLSSIEDKVSQGWLPYLAIEKKSKEDSLLFLCDEGYTRGSYLPVEQGLAIAVKICDILEVAHARDIIYRDHKILHYYWNARLRKISIIDWNVAKWHPNGLVESDLRLDLVQFGARTLHHILTGRPAPGALPVGPNQLHEIEMAPEHYAPAWTYDDTQRLPDEVRELLAQVMAGGYTDAARLREDLLLQLPYQNIYRKDNAHR